ncbi:hypothetical protein G9A89_002205 [Geosiphon pyriformis]|nr:hypothetical protein G9A89_002205 [Geosiphon pyriformis]
MCNIRGINNPVKQDDITYWHKEMNNVISIVTETKLKDKIRSWIMSKFDGIWADNVNSLIARAVNKSSFVILGSDFNEDGSHKSASFKKWFDLGLINSLSGSSYGKEAMWNNSQGVAKTIDYMFVLSNLVNVILDHDVAGVEKFFDTDHRAVFVSVGFGGLLDVQLNLLCKQVNKDHWKYNFKDANDALWSKFKDETAANAAMLYDDFLNAKMSSDLNAMWDAVRKTLCFSANVVFKKKWFKEYDDFPLNDIQSVLLKIRKSYRAFKLLESKCAENSYIKSAINRKMESFESNKNHTIRSVLEQSFCKVVLDHLVVGKELILKPDHVKDKVDEIIEGWTWKRGVVCDPLEHVFDGAFFNVINCISFIELFGVVSNLPDRKAAGLLGISNELWKYCNSSALNMLLVLINSCLSDELIPALIETARKIFSKILSDRISLACSKNSLVRIKMYSKFIRFFGGIYGGRTNWIMTDFGLTSGYYVHDGLDQREVFSLFLWQIFYDPLLCEVKRQESVCGYKLNSYFISRTGRVESQAELTSFLAAGTFVDDTI